MLDPSMFEVLRQVLASQGSKDQDVKEECLVVEANATDSNSAAVVSLSIVDREEINPNATNEPI